MAKIGSNANYSQIRSEVQIAFDKQGKSKNLRFETGKELYLHDSSGLKRSNPFKVQRRAKKHLDATEKIKAALNREFPNLRDLNGDLVKVGDLVFERLNDPESLDHEAFKKIDQEVANILRESGETAVAKHFELSASGSTTGALRLANWPRVQRDAQVFRDAMIADAMASGQTRIEAEHTCDEIVKTLKTQGAQQASGRNLQDIDLGLNMQTIEKAIDLMQGKGLGCASLKNVVHSIRLNRQFQTVVPQLRTLNTEAKACVSNLAFGSSNQLYGHVIDFLERSDDILANYGTDHRELTVGQLTQQMTRASVLVHLLETKDPHTSWDQQVVQNLREQIDAINELSVSSLSPDRRLNLARRPMTSHFGEMNVTNELHEMELPHLADQDGLELKSTQIYSGSKGPGTSDSSKSTFDRVVSGYQDAMKQVDNALELFQGAGDDRSLAKLATAIQLATVHSDRYSKLLRSVSHRKFSSGSQSNLKIARDLVAAQRKTLQRIGRLVSQVNDTRNAIAQGVNLPNAAQVDRQGGLDRDLASRALSPIEAKQLIHEQSRSSIYSDTSDYYLPAKRTRAFSESSSQSKSDIKIPRSNSESTISNLSLGNEVPTGQSGLKKPLQFESHDFSAWNVKGDEFSKQQELSQNSPSIDNKLFRSPSLTSQSGIDESQTQNNDVDFLPEAPGNWDESLLLDLNRKDSTTVDVRPQSNSVIDDDPIVSKPPNDQDNQIDVNIDNQVSSQNISSHSVIATAAGALKAEVMSQWPDDASNSRARSKAIQALDFLVTNAEALVVDDLYDADIDEDWEDEKYELRNALNNQFGQDSSIANKLVQLLSTVSSPDNPDLLNQLQNWQSPEPQNPSVLGNDNGLQSSQPPNAPQGQINESSPLNNENSVSLEPNSIINESQESLPVVDYQVAVQNLQNYLQDPRCEDVYFPSTIRTALSTLRMEAMYGPTFALNALNDLGMNFDLEASVTEDFVAEAITRFIADSPLPVDEPIDNAPDIQVDSKAVIDLCQNSFKMSPDQFRKEVASIMGLPDSASQKIVINQQKSLAYGVGLEVSYESNKTNVEKMVVRFYPEQMGVDHEGHLNLGLIKLKAGSQGAGSSKKMFGGMLELMKRTNLRSMSTEANITVGGYVWARMGFHPSNGDFERMGKKGEWGLGSVKGRLQSFVDAANTKKIKVKSSVIKNLESIIATLQEPQALNPRKMIRTLMTLSTSIQLEDLEGIFGKERADELKAIAKAGGFKELTLGKALLLGTSWDGTFDVKDDMGHMKKYVATQTVKKAFSKITGMLKSQKK